MNDKKRNSLKSGRLMILITVVNRKKTDYFLDYIQEFGANMQFSALGRGTANSEILDMLGLDDNEKTVIFSVLKEDDAKSALAGIKEKLVTLKKASGIAFTIPMSSVIGVSIFGFLSDSRETVRN